MSLAHEIREERVRYGVSQEELAKKLHVSSSAVSNYERGTRDMPEDLLDRAIDALNSPRLRIMKCSSCQTGIFGGMPYLDLVDLHSVVTKNKLAEELEEAADALQSLVLINKSKPDDLSQSDRDQLTKVLEELLDLLPAISLHMKSLIVHYDVDLRVAREVNKKKYFDRGYWSAKKMPAAATAGHR